MSDAWTVDTTKVWLSANCVSRTNSYCLRKYTFFLAPEIAIVLFDFEYI